MEEENLFIEFRCLPGKDLSANFEKNYTRSSLSEFIMQSSDPNTFAKALDNGRTIMRISLRKIKAGEEITADYTQLQKIIHELGYTTKSKEK